MHLGKRKCMGSGSVECVAWNVEGGHLASWCLCEPAAGQADRWHAKGAGQPAPWAWPGQGWWDQRDGASDVGPCVHAGVTIRPDSCISTGTPMQLMYSMWKGMDARRYGDHSGPFFCLLKHSIQLVMLSYTAIRNPCPALRSFELPDWQLRLHSLGFAVTLHPRIFHAIAAAFARARTSRSALWTARCTAGKQGRGWVQCRVRRSPARLRGIGSRAGQGNRGVTKGGARGLAGAHELSKGVMHKHHSAQWRPGDCCFCLPTHCTCS
jgi:hypothetical protein